MPPPAMFKRKTSRVRNRPQIRVLKANVMSPRIFWFDVRHALAQLSKLLLWAALIGGVGFGIWLGVQKGLVQNDEFRLQRIELAANPAVDEIRLLNVAGIDPSGSLFDCDAGMIEERLRALPEIAGADVKREFPGTLVIDLTVREPMLWVANKGEGVMPRDRITGLVVDRSGLAFPCPKGLFEEALALPVIELGKGGESLKSGSKVVHPDFVRGIRLYSAAGGDIPDAEAWIDTIWQHKSWASRMTTRDGMEVTFGHDDIERQMSDLLAAVQHAREKGARISTITLIGTRNLPVTYHETPPPKAIPVEQAPVKVRPAIDRDLNNLLDR